MSPLPHFRRFCAFHLTFFSAGRLFAGLATLVVASLAIQAQLRSGPILGTVHDEQGRAVANASVSLQNAGSGATRTVITDAEGKFLFSDTPPGNYRCLVQSEGFSDAAREIRAVRGGHDVGIIVLAPGVIKDVVTVVAQRAARDTLQTPEAATVISSKQLEERTPGTVADILRDLPGTYTQSQGFLTRPIIRGLEGNRVLILVDGERLNNGRTPTSHVGNGVETGLVDVETLESVEVIRGAGSVLYGTEALAGTINFITRPPVQADGGVRFSGDMTPFFTSNGPGGRYGGSLSLSAKRFAFRIRQSFENFSDYDAGGSVEAGFAAITPQFNTRTRDVFNSGYRTNATRLEGRVFFNDKTFLRSSYERLDTGRYAYPLQSTFNFLFSNRDKLNFGFVAREISPLLANVQISGYRQWQSRRDQIIIDVPGRLFQVSDREINPTTFGFDAQAILTPSSKHVVTLGASFYRDFSADDRVVIRGSNPSQPGGITPAQARAQAMRLTDDSAFARQLRQMQPRRDVPNATFQDFALFAQDEFTINRRLKFVGGLRLDRYASRAQDTPSFDIFNTAPLNQIGLDGLQSLRHANMAFTGSLGVVVSPTERVSLTTRIGRSYREPNIFDRYNAGASHTISPTTRSLTAPNPNLKPETGINLDAGVKARFAKFAGSVAYFNNTYDNFISIFGEPLSGVAPVPGPFGPLTVFQRQNINRIRIQGFEAEAEVPFRLPQTLKHSFVTILGNVSYTRGDDVKANRPVDPFLFPVVPLKTVVGARWNTANNRYWSEYRARIVNGQDRLPAGSPFAAPGQPRLGFTAHDLRGGVNFNREHYGVSLTLGVENLGNRFYQDLFSLFGEPARGRAFVTGLRIRFF